MSSGPTARLLSEGLRNCAVPCGPRNPAPKPSKLSSSGTCGPGPGDVCSTAAPAARMSGAESAELCRPFARAGDRPQPAFGQGPAYSWAESGRSEESGGDRSNFIAERTSTAPALL